MTIRRGWLLWLHRPECWIRHGHVANGFVTSGQGQAGEEASAAVLLTGPTEPRQLVKQVSGRSPRPASPLSFPPGPSVLSLSVQMSTGIQGIKGPRGPWHHLWREGGARALETPTLASALTRQLPTVIKKLTPAAGGLHSVPFWCKLGENIWSPSQPKLWGHQSQAQILPGTEERDLPRQGQVPGPSIKLSFIWNHPMKQHSHWILWNTLSSLRTHTDTFQRPDGSQSDPPQWPCVIPFLLYTSFAVSSLSSWIKINSWTICNRHHQDRQPHFYLSPTTWPCVKPPWDTAGNVQESGCQATIGPAPQAARSPASSFPNLPLPRENQLKGY